MCFLEIEEEIMKMAQCAAAIQPLARNASSWRFAKQAHQTGIVLK
jgi:hypothetical protein